MPITTIAKARAVWKLGHRGQAQILFIDDSESTASARRWPDSPMPGCRKGHVAFDPNAYPNLQAVRTLMPDYEVLWDAVAADLAALRVPNSPATRAHSTFFELPWTDKQ